MGKRIVFATLVVALLLLLPSAAALAGPKAHPPGNAYGVTGNPGNANAWGPGGNGNGGNGNSKAAANASKGMNRPGAEGTWKENGHEPAVVSAPQGHAPSDPDFTGNGGVDKPGRSGGFSADKDGNNGCGNDDDREDDNNGWCGRRPVSQGPGPVVLPGPKITPPAAGGVKLPATGADLSQLMWLATGMTLSGHALRSRSRRAL